jgi:hypothetical protein
LIVAAAAVNPSAVAPGFATQFCDVEVDPETGKVKILRFVAARTPQARNRLHRALRKSNQEDDRQSSCQPAGCLSAVPSAPFLDQAAGRSRTPSGTTPSRARRHSAISSLRASATMALNLIRRARGMDSLRLRRKVAAWDDDFLASLIAA